MWAALWLLMAWLWLVEAGGASGITNAINQRRSGMSWLSSVQDWFANAAKGDGVVIAVLLAALSAVIGVAVAVNWRPKLFIALAIGLNLLYWVVGQGFGGIPQGGATDPNAGLLFVLLAYTMYALVPYEQPAPSAARGSPNPREIVMAGSAGTDHEIRLTTVIRVPSTWRDPIAGNHIYQGGATMFGRQRFRSAARRAAVMIAIATLLAGCASAEKNLTVPSTTATSAVSSSSSGMAGMNMGSGSSTNAGSVSVNGVKAVPTQLLGSALWQGMKISVEATTPLPFVIYNGTSEQMVKAGPKTSFHLMVMLSDDQTGVAIPYASVWATIKQGSKIYYDARQWPMISRYMGPHYGNDVSVPGAGTYQLSLLVSPPVSARHVEYQNVWLHPHRVNLTFHWAPPA